MSTQKENEKAKTEINRLIEELVKNVIELKKFDVYFDTEVSNNPKTTGYYWHKMNVKYESLDEFSHVERQAIENIYLLTGEIVKKYEIMFMSVIDESDQDENGKPISIDKVRYGFLRFKPGKYDKVLDALLKENKYDIELFNMNPDNPDCSRLYKQMLWNLFDMPRKLMYAESFQDDVPDAKRLLKAKESALKETEKEFGEKIENPDMLLLIQSMMHESKEKK
jgi:hypothetical protein